MFDGNMAPVCEGTEAYIHTFILITRTVTFIYIESISLRLFFHICVAVGCHCLLLCQLCCPINSFTELLPYILSCSTDFFQSKSRR